MKELIAPLSLFTVFILFLVMLGGYNMRIAQEHDTFAQCLIAHNENNKESEEKCGEMQDNTNTEFVCNTRCWLELK